MPRQALAAVTDEDLNAVKKMLQELSEKVKTLEQEHERTSSRTNRTSKRSSNYSKSWIRPSNWPPMPWKKPRRRRPGPTTRAGRRPSRDARFQMVGDAETRLRAHPGPAQRVRASRISRRSSCFAPMTTSCSRRASISPWPTTRPTRRGHGLRLRLELCHAGLSAQRLRHRRGRQHVAAAGHLLGTQRRLAQQNARQSDAARVCCPANGSGLQLRGAVPVGDAAQMVTYAVYGVNGPSSVDGTGNSGALDLGGNVGFLSRRPRFRGNMATVCRARLSRPWATCTPIPAAAVASGGSIPGSRITMSSWGSPANRANGTITATCGRPLVVDAAVHVSPSVEIKGEYINTWVETTDLGTIRPNGWWVQGGYKLSGLNLDWPLINNIELVGRYDRIQRRTGSRPPPPNATRPGLFITSPTPCCSRATTNGCTARAPAPTCFLPTKFSFKSPTDSEQHRCAITADPMKIQSNETPKPACAESLALGAGHRLGTACAADEQPRRRHQGANRAVRKRPGDHQRLQIPGRHQGKLRGLLQKCSQCHKLSRPDQFGLRPARRVVALHQAHDAQARQRHQRGRRQEDLRVPRL